MGKNNTKAIKVAFILKTTGLDYDDRLRKEIVSLQQQDSRVKPYIFVMLPENKTTKGITSYGVQYESIYIPARDKYPSAQKKLLKAYQFYSVLKKQIREFDAIWCADVDTLFIPFLSHNKYRIWDLHELPLGLYENGLKRILLKFLFSRCSLVLHANPQRIDYLASLSNGLIDAKKHLAIRNYPSFHEATATKDTLFNEFIKWKKDRDCVYLQGLAEYGRAAYESVEAVLRTNKLCAVVIGKFDQSALEKLREERRGELEQRVFFTGMIPQLKTPLYTSHCKLSMVFYTNIRPNNYYCEANRFYQSVSLGVPILCGNNPPMRALVEKYGFGVSIDDDGGDISAISNGLDKLLKDYDVYHNNCLNNRDAVNWESQTTIFKSILNKIENDL